MMGPLDCSNFSNTSGNNEFIDVTPECALFDFLIYSVSITALVVLGVIGNIVSFTVLLKEPKNNKSATPFLLRTLAVADTLVLLMALPVYALPMVYPYMQNAGFYQIYHGAYPNLLPYLWPIYQVPYTATIYVTVLVTINRYMAVCKPHNTARYCSLQASHRQVLYIVLFAVVYNIPRFFEFEKKEVCSGVNQTTLQFGTGGLFGNSLAYRIIYTNILYFVVLLGGPLLVLSFLNFQLILALKARAVRRANMGKTDSQQDLTLVLVVVICAFIIFQLPTFIDHIFWTVLDPSLRMCKGWHYYYTAFSDLLAVCNSSINFLIYCITSASFRSQLKNNCSKRSNDSGNSMTELSMRTPLTKV